ncbi:MAG TPA: phosphoribosylformylglycinamidine cyclo-ligase [Candidatus Eisenbacteria bacterium]|nr:phosphoribosylformylglycinamidine cyclo-ligase [Candidatus Eisenbacteria bacterium]
MSRYEEAGVSIKRGEEAVARIKELCRSTFGPAVLGDVGLFAGAYRVPGAPGQVFLSSIDGVGTKLRVAILAGRHDTVGYDLVCHSANDILVHGGVPLFFLDYIAMGALDPARVEQLVVGLARGCREVGCALIGGETAEMPGLYAPNDYDLAGAIVGVVSEQDLVTGAGIEAGDQILGLPAIGLHTNGYSLARKILFDTLDLAPTDLVPGLEATVADVLLAPHPYYGPAVRAARAAGNVRGMAHITGGGIPGNLVRVLPAGVRATIAIGSWPELPIYHALREAGGVPEAEAFDVWNMGLGLLLIVKKGDADSIARALTEGGHAAYRVGSIEAGSREVRLARG